uniref:Uncharacterized protein n=1 Tax=Fagus sylvatica TaxID=28930 RepID=A0A2N9FVN0_FAGSY
MVRKIFKSKRNVVRVQVPGMLHEAGEGRISEPHGFEMEGTRAKQMVLLAGIAQEAVQSFHNQTIGALVSPSIMGPTKTHVHEVAIIQAVTEERNSSLVNWTRTELFCTRKYFIKISRNHPRKRVSGCKRGKLLPKLKSNVEEWASVNGNFHKSQIPPLKPSTHPVKTEGHAYGFRASSRDTGFNDYYQGRAMSTSKFHEVSTEVVVTGNPTVPNENLHGDGDKQRPLIGENGMESIEGQKFWTLWCTVIAIVFSSLLTKGRCRRVLSRVMIGVKASWTAAAFCSKLIIRPFSIHHSIEVRCYVYHYSSKLHIVGEVWHLLAHCMFHSFLDSDPEEVWALLEPLDKVIPNGADDSPVEDGLAIVKGEIAIDRRRKVVNLGVVSLCTRALKWRFFLSRDKHLISILGGVGMRVILRGDHRRGGVNFNVKAEYEWAGRGSIP